MTATIEAPQTPKTGEAAKQTKKFFGRFGAMLIGFAGLAIIFEIIARMELVSAKLFPPSSVVLPRVVQLVVDPEFLTQVGSTLSVTLIGLAIGFVIAVPIGLLIGTYRNVAIGATPIVDFLRSVPGIAILPLLVLTLGSGPTMKITMVAFVSVFPILFNTMYGVRAVDRVALETTQSFRIGRLRTWFRVVLPSALPLILTGLRIAIAVSLAVEVAVELTYGTQEGIGSFILQASFLGTNHDTVFAAVILAGLLGWGLSALSSLLTRRVVAWQVRSRK